MRKGTGQFKSIERILNRSALRLTSKSFAGGFPGRDELLFENPIMKALLLLANSRRAIRRILVVAMLFSALQGTAYSGEPESHGHSLSYWLEHWMPGGGSAEERKLAETAIRDIGTNGLPAMLVWLRYEPSQTKTNIMEFLKRMRQTAYGRWIPPQLTYENGPPPAHIGFNVLGPAAAPAIPELTLIANDAQHPRPAARAMMALSAIGPAALPAIEARLANTNFPVGSIPAVNMYLRTRTSTGRPGPQLGDAEAKPILLELQTNANPLLAEGASQLLKSMQQPSFWQRGKTKTFSEASSDIRVERMTGGHARPGWNIPAWAKLSPEEQLAASNTIQAALTAPPAFPKDGDEPYPYALYPGTPAWDFATVEERIGSLQIPKSWREHATSWQLFRSAIGSPYFRTVYSPGLGFGFAQSYQAARSSSTVPLLKEVDTAPEFGTNILRWLSELDLEKVEASQCEKPYERCFMEYRTVYGMATLDSALNTLDVNSRQRLYHLAVWDADYFLSRENGYIASGPLELIYTLADKPENFRGALPPAAVLKRPIATKPPLRGFADGSQDPAIVRPQVAAAKSALNLKERP
jgi:hypothetical protein